MFSKKIIAIYTVTSWCLKTLTGERQVIFDLSGKAVSVTEINTDEISTEYNTYDSDGKLLKSENSDGEEATQRTVPCVPAENRPLCS